MKVCNTCGTMNDDMNMSCTTCGSAFPMVQPQMGYGQPAMGEQPQMSYGQPVMGGQPQMDYGQPIMGGQPQMGYGQPVMNVQSMGAANKSKKGIIIAVVIILVVVIIAAVCIPMIVKAQKEKKAKELLAKEKKEVEELIEKSVKAMNDGDSEYLASVSPDFLDYTEDDYDETFEYLEWMGFEIELVSIEEVEKMKAEDMEDLVHEIEDDYDEKVDIEKAYTAEVTAEITLSYEEYSESDESTEDFICIMLDGKWYVYQGIM